MIAEPAGWLPKLVLLFALGLAAPRARAEGEDVLDDRQGATRLTPEPGTLGAPPGTVVKKAEPEPETPRVPSASEWTISAHTRFAALPDFVLDALFQDHPGFSSVAAGLAIEYGDVRDSALVFELDWMKVGLAGYNWREVSVPPGAATYAEVDLHFISLDVGYRWAIRLGGPVDLVLGAGVGVGGLVGEAKTDEVLPTCSPPVQDCGHWKDATHGDADLPTRVLPVLHLTAGLQVDLGETGLVRLQLGLRDVLYVGLNAGLRL